MVLSAQYQKSVMSFFKPLSHSFLSVLPDNSETCLLVQACRSLGYFLGPPGHWTLSTAPKDKRYGAEIPSIDKTSRPLPLFLALEIHRKIKHDWWGGESSGKKELGSWQHNRKTSDSI